MPLLGTIGMYASGRIDIECRSGRSGVRVKSTALFDEGKWIFNCRTGLDICFLFIFKRVAVFSGPLDTFCKKKPGILR